MAGQSFNGFPEEALYFMAQLATHNDREWFNARKKDYLNLVQAPALAFIEAMGERLQEIAPDIIYDTRTNGSGSLMRIYRDVRFSEDKSPYHTDVRIAFWEGPGKKNTSPAFFFGWGPKTAGLGAGVYGFPRPLLEAYREAVVDEKRGPELVKILAKIQKAGDYQLGGEQYKRMPRGYDSDHPRADMLLFKSLFARLSLEPAVVTNRDLVEVVYAHFRRLAPLQQWLVQIRPPVEA